MDKIVYSGNCPVFIFDATYEEAGHEILHDQQKFFIDLVGARQLKNKGP